MTVLVAVLVALAVLAAAGPGGRPVPAPASAGWHRGRGGAGTAPSAATALVAGRGPASDGGDLGALLLAVAARLRAGAGQGEAWRAVLGTAADDAGDGAPSPGALLAATEPRAERLRRLRPRRRRDDARRARAHAVVVGTRTAGELGAPLAEVLDDLAAAVAADAEHEGEVSAALAGPRATSRVLVLLPVLGLLVGEALGARPWHVLTSGGVGTACGVLGVLLVLAGRAWVAALLRRAAATGGGR
ncbi:type II secretion system F family protein [Cellulomonas sp.]|uniref:type II secretion system F family protein n=1 Tax=Cellulomonas sp. TaxID=40001 RepID=UPI002810DA9D|nr:type II secretion system F family protein [Cellulomonas sp.]